MDRFKRAKSIAAFRAVIRHRKVSWPIASVPPEGPGSSLGLITYSAVAEIQEESAKPQ